MKLSPRATRPRSWRGLGFGGRRRPRRGVRVRLPVVGPDGPAMIGGGLGNFAPGEWTDDTTMAWCILDVAATGADLRTDEALTAIARRFRAWYDTRPPDIGNQTRTILGAVGADPPEPTMTATSYDLHARTGHTAGNGSLMRTAPVALPYLDDPDALVEAARKVGALTHYDPHAQEACVLWSPGDPARHPARRARHPGRPDLPRRRGRRLLDRAARRGRAVRARAVQPQRLGRRRAAGGVVGDRPHARPDATDRVPAPRRQPRHRDRHRRRHRHRRRDRRRTARRPLGRLGRAGRVAPDPARLPGPRSRGLDRTGRWRPRPWRHITRGSRALKKTPSQAAMRRRFDPAASRRRGDGRLLRWPGPQREAQLGGRSRVAGPSSRVPSGANREPCSGQSQLRSASFHVTTPARCGQTALTRQIRPSTVETATGRAGDPSTRPCPSSGVEAL